MTPITEPENAVQVFRLQTARRSLLPALSMMPGNAVCTVEVWNILRIYDLTVRWRIYGEWRDETYESHPELNAQRVLREDGAKGILCRLPSQTVESLAGPVAKMAHTSSCVFFTNAVNQIQPTTTWLTSLFRRCALRPIWASTFSSSWSLMPWVILIRIE